MVDSQWKFVLCQALLWAMWTGVVFQAWLHAVPFELLVLWT